VRQLTAVVSFVAAIVLILVIWFLFPSQAAIFLNEILLAAILIAIVPSAITSYFHQKWMDKIDDQLPVLVRGISESQETGVTFVKAFDKVVEDKMVGRPLADEVEKLSLQMSWGLSFEDALKNLRDRIGSPVVSRFCALVLEASRSGGQIKKVFTATSGFMEDIRETDRETSSQMKPYIIIVYAAFFVLVFTSVILLRAFFAPLEGLSNILSPVAIMGVKQYKDFFYRTMLVSGLLGGLMAGKISDRRVASGLKHSILLLVVGYVIMFVLVPPNWMVM
jgi:flagellar protein FlaJ